MNVTVDGSEIFHQFVDSLSHTIKQGLVHPRWLVRISSINSTTQLNGDFNISHEIPINQPV